MALPASHYAGREQAYIKHYLLRTYFSDLIHKIASAYNEIVYVDGFSGPWQSADEQSGDTSFGIALAEMLFLNRVEMTEEHERTREVLNRPGHITIGKRC